MNKKLANLLGISVLLASGLSSAYGQATPVTANGNQPPKTEKSAPAPKVAPKVSAPGMVVFKDPVTGQIRQPNAGEIEELLQSANPVQSLAIRRGAQTITGPGTAVGIRLDDSYMTSMVMTKGADGKLEMECVTGAKNATDAGLSPVKPVKPTPKKEILNDEK
jgi:hypothetical protein